MATRSKTKAKAKKNCVKNTFQAVQGVCPELVNLFDYLVGQSHNGSKGVALGDVEHYLEYMADAISQLIDIFDSNTALSDIENLEEVEDLCC